MDKRFILALVLSAVILIGWFSLVVPLVTPPPKPADTAGEPGEEETAPGEEEAEGKEPGKEAGAEPGEEPAEEPGEEPAEKPGEEEDGGEAEPPASLATQADPVDGIELENEAFRLVLTNRGASLQELILQDFLDPEQKELFPMLQEIQAGVRSFFWTFGDGEEGPGTQPWEILETESPGEAAFVFHTATDLDLTKRFRLPDPGEAVPYTFRLSLTVKNAGDETVDVGPRLTGPAGIPPERKDYNEIKAYVASGISAKDPTVKDFDPADVREESRTLSVNNLHYAGVGNKYFGAVLVPKTPEAVDKVEVRPLLDLAVYQSALAAQLGQIEAGLSEAQRREAEKEARREARRAATINVQPVIAFEETALAPGEEITWEFLVFAGPKREAYLKALSIQGIRTSVRSFCLPGSWTRGLSWLMLKILLFFNAIFCNFGVAIIGLTVLVRALMSPLSFRMQISMNEYQKKMKKVQPKLKEIKERYKDKARQQQEMAKLMREHGVSLIPLKGCLPIFLQFPIFIALFVTLRNSLELRHAGFLWIRDLASPDRLFALPAFIRDLPLIGGFIGSYFNLLPLLWIGMMILQQRLSPMAQAQTDDPQMASQRKMMLIMSVVFGFLFFRIESGAALYIIVSTIWGMGEAFLIRRRIQAKETA